MKKTTFLVGLLFSMLLVMSSAYAANNQLFIKEEANTFEGSVGDQLSYNITLLNRGTSPIYINMNFLYASADFSRNRFTLGAGQEEVIEMTFNVPVGAKTGLSYQSILFFDDEGASYDTSVLIPVKVIPAAGSEYADVKINKVSTEPEEIIPSQEFLIKMNVTNPIRKVAVTFTFISEFGNTQGTIYLSEGTKEYELPVTLYNTTPGINNAEVHLDFSDYTLVKNMTLDVGSYSTCDVSKEESSTLFGKEFQATVKNKGNVMTTCQVSDDISAIGQLLLSEVSQGYTVEEGELSWGINVKPGATVILSYRLSYAPLLAIPFVIIFVIFGFWYLTRKVNIRKELVDHKRYPGYMDLKVQLRVKNLTNKNLEDVKIKERLPTFAKEIRDYGTIPGKTIKKGKNKYVSWDVDLLRPYEERVFSYKFRTSLEVLGKIKFPVTEVEFKDEKGEKRKSTSNVLVVEVE